MREILRSLKGKNYELENESNPISFLPPARRSLENSAFPGGAWERVDDSDRLETCPTL